MTDNLHNTIVDIALSTGRMEIVHVPPPGPSNWDEVGPCDFGPEQDFDVTDHGSIFIFDCLSNAALQWCYHHLPEDCPRWGARGFAIEHRFIAAIVEGARCDNLLTRDDYLERMGDDQEQQRQWEDDA